MSCSIFDVKEKLSGRGTSNAIFAVGDFNSCIANEVPTEFCELGRISNMMINQEPETVDVPNWQCGKKEVIDQITLENGYEFALNIHDLTRENLAFAWRGSDQAVEAQAALTAASVDPLDFSADSSGTGKMYSLTQTIAGKKQALYGLTNLVVTTAASAVLVDGVDYKYLKSQGHIKFLTTQSELLTIVADAPASTVTPMEMGGGQNIKGWLRIFHTPTIDTDGISCDPEIVFDVPVIISFEDSLELNTDDFASIDLKFTARANPVMRDLRVDA